VTCAPFQEASSERLRRTTRWRSAPSAVAIVARAVSRSIRSTDSRASRTALPACRSAGSAGAKPDACGDGIDQDCSGVADDGTTASGATCNGIPGGVRARGEQGGGSSAGGRARGRRKDVGIVPNGEAKAEAPPLGRATSMPTRETFDQALAADCSSEAADLNMLP
jgi:hypothetical protein